LNSLIRAVLIVTCGGLIRLACLRLGGGEAAARQGEWLVELEEMLDAGDWKVAIMFALDCPRAAFGLPETAPKREGRPAADVVVEDAPTSGLLVKIANDHYVSMHKVDGRVVLRPLGNSRTGFQPELLDRVADGISDAQVGGLVTLIRSYYGGVE
jgi:hypothetical protein